MPERSSQRPVRYSEVPFVAFTLQLLAVWLLRVPGSGIALARERGEQAIAQSMTRRDERIRSSLNLNGTIGKAIDRK